MSNKPETPAEHIGKMLRGVPIRPNPTDTLGRIAITPNDPELGDPALTDWDTYKPQPEPPLVSRKPTKAERIATDVELAMNGAA